MIGSKNACFFTSAASPSPAPNLCVCGGEERGGGKALPYNKHLRINRHCYCNVYDSNYWSAHVHVHVHYLISNSTSSSSARTHTCTLHSSTVRTHTPHTLTHSHDKHTYSLTPTHPTHNTLLRQAHLTHTPLIRVLGEES